MISEKAINRPMKGSTITLFCSTLIVTFFILLTTSSAADTITANQTIRDDGNNTIESAGGIFELGFFSPGSSKNRYLGIWYKKISNRTVVWIANRETPITDNSGVLRVDSNGILVLVHSTNSIIWTSNSSRSVAKPLVQLLDTGNLVLRYENDTDPANFLWQSFDHPVNNILPGMKLGWDLEKGLDRYLTSWKSADDPSPGNFTFRVNLEGYPQMLVSQGSVVQFRFGPWDGIQFSGVAFDIPDLSFDLKLIFNQREIYSTFDLVNQSIAVRFVLNPTGDIQLLTWMDQTQNWTFGTYVGVLWDECDQFALCGAYGNCNITEYRLGQVPCGCLKGYEPKFPEKWNAADWSDGCVRKTEFECGNGDVFVKYPNLKLPDTRRSVFNRSTNLAECERVCSRNCSCTGYSNIDIRQGGTGCMLWFDELLDIRDYRDNGLDFFVRTAASELVEKRSTNNKTRVNISIIIIPVLVGLLVLLGLFLIYMSKKRKLRRRRRMLTFNPENDGRNENEREDLDLPLFDFQIIADATNNFSQNNKLGEGGFGPVYKGILDEKQEIAVKRLSKTSRQGLDEFKNEVSCIAKLQHRNLVRLLGCCIEEDEMMLIYEYMPNKSLDFFIFDKELKKSLDWSKRYNIINGIAKGLLYLHQDSRLRIIHRDLKASNILLDQDMSPRISDFGLARSFGGNETLVNTARVVGTYGYMSPEYAIDGLFSVKSDVYSLGVVILEVMSGKKIRGFYDSEDNLNLLGHAWKLFKEGKYLNLIDEAIVESCKQSEVLRAIQIGLLCVQPYPKDRPNMPFVVSMLSSENELPQPNQPGFFTERRVSESDSSSSNQGLLVSNELSISFFGPR